MEFDSHFPIPKVSVGALLPKPIRDRIARIVIEGQRNMPAMCEVEFNDDDSAVTDNVLMRPGQTLKVESAPASEDPTQTSLGPIFDGEVVAIEASFTPHGGKRVLLRGYDRSHRLHRTRQTRTFLMQPDNVVATQIASEAGLIARVDPTGAPQEYLCQRNQTDWEFLTERARENGFEVGVSMGQLLFRRAGPDPAAGVPQQLAYGDNLLSFRTRVTSAEQAKKTTVTAWNPLLKTAVMGVSPPPVPENTPKDPQLMPMTVAARFGSSEDSRTDLPLDLPPAAIGHATARRNHTAGASFEAEGRCVGNPAMRPGGKVVVSDVGKTFSGTYTLSSVRHTFDGSGFYTTFTISGLHDRSLLGLTQPGAVTRASNGARARIDGPVIAKVSNTNDEKMMGRVKVEFPWLGDGAESHWAPVVSPGGGKDKGLQLIPEVGDTVLVAFEHGDVRRPYVLGGVYNTQDMMPSGPAPPPVSGGKTNIRMLKTRAGHVLTFDDTPGQEGITIETHRGSKVAIVEAPQPAIELSNMNGQNSVTIDKQGITVQSSTNIELKATGQLKLSGTGGVSIEGQGPVSLKGAAATNVEGSITTVKSTGPLNLQGTPMKLN